jgi:glucokinase
MDIALVVDAALDGDPDVLNEVQAMGRRLGETIADTMSLLPVDQVVVGGGLSVLGRFLLDPMRSACDKALASSKYQHPPRFALATYGRDSTLVGAAFLANELIPAPESTLMNI